MATSLTLNEERQGAKARSNLDVNFPQHTISLQGDAFKLLPTLDQYSEMVRQTIRQHAEELPVSWAPRSLSGFLKTRRSAFGLSQSYLTTLCRFLSWNKLSVEMPRVPTPAGAQTVLCTQRGVPAFTSLTSSGTPSRGNAGQQPQIHYVSLSFPAPIRKLSLCKFNDGDHGGKTSCIKI